MTIKYYDLYTVKPYPHWLRVTLGCCVPSLWDWKNVCSTFWKFFKTLFDASLRLVVRLLIILTFPISVPLIAYALSKRNQKVIRERIKERDNLQRELQKLNQKQ